MSDPANVDTAALRSYLSDELDASVTGIEVLHDGLNLTLGISTEREERAYALRRPNELRHTALFNDLRREHRVLRRLRETAVPAPVPVAFCEDTSLLGDAFFVTSYLDGTAVPFGSDLPERFQDAASRERVADRLIDWLARIHSLDVGRFEGSCKRRTPLDQVDRAAERLDEAARVTGYDSPRLRSVAEWLRANAPIDPGVAFLHGDFRPGNVLFVADDEPAVAGILDWETAILGDPRTELGYLLLRWRDEGDPTPPLDDLAAKYGEEAVQPLRERNEAGLAPFTAKPGSPDRRELVARYEERGVSFENQRFYRAHAAFMLAAVWADLHRVRTEAGADSEWEPHVEYVAMLADSIANGEFRL